MPTIIDAKPGRWCAAALLVAETGRYLTQKRDAFDWIDFPGSIRVLDSMANHLQIGLHIADASRIPPTVAQASGRQSGYSDFCNFPVHFGRVRASEERPAAPFAIS